MPFQYQNVDDPIQPDTETLHKLEEAANQLQVSEEALRQAIDEGIFRGVDKDGETLLPDEELERAKALLAQNHQAQSVDETLEDVPPSTSSSESSPDEMEPDELDANSSTAYQKDKQKEPFHTQYQEVIPLYRKGENHYDEGPSKHHQKWKAAFERITEQLRRLQDMRPLSRLRVKERLEGFFRLIESKKKKDVDEEFDKKEVSLKLGFMTGQNEMFCDFCEVHDRFYPGAIFADVYVDGGLKWMMCPNCLNYCRQQSNGSMEQNVRARFNHLAHRLEKEAQRARKLAASENFQVPQPHEWEAWETASVTMQEVASAYAGPGYDAGEGFDSHSGFDSDFGSGPSWGFNADDGEPDFTADFDPTEPPKDSNQSS
ncbi:hypothetical protein SAMN05444487_11749 [Marininema mesophilum]|uniref:Uncharacterized protein n=1 Tax=Marininema mesophilum TaxID=1048340 RepID=A0A1H3BLB1_9BACL|nr:hypothetical protein [Marininema mesophilum]SDX42750.1 hypothetical protein SAMN05444487_11749 [Marininema mesophilum]